MASGRRGGVLELVVVALWLLRLPFLSCGAPQKFCAGYDKRLRLLAQEGPPLLEPSQCGAFVQAPVVLRFNRRPKVEFTVDPPAGNYTLVFASIRNSNQIKTLWRVSNILPVGRELTKNGTTIKSYEPPDVSQPGIYRFVFWVSKQEGKNRTEDTSALPPPERPPMASFEFHYQMGTIILVPPTQGPVWTLPRPGYRPQGAAGGIPNIVVNLEKNKKLTWNKEKGKWIRGGASSVGPSSFASVLLFALTAAFLRVL